MSRRDTFRERLDDLTRRVFAGAVREDSLARLTAGASQQTWTFDVETAAGVLPLILRHRPQAGAEPARTIGPEIEAALIRIAGEAGVPEPGVPYVLEPGDNLGRGFISDRIEGETLARRILRDAEFAEVRPRLANLCGQALARIHGIATDGLPALPTKYATGHLDELHASYRATGARSAVFEAAFRWLYDNAPPQPSRPSLVHGDFRNGNLIIGPEGIRAVLDWELAHLGDPAQDLGWITVNSWRFGAIDKPVGGFGEIADLLAGYAEAGGTGMDEAQVKYWQALGSLRWGVMCRQMSWTPGETLSIERAMIGRRVSETELDLLDILAPDQRR